MKMVLLVIGSISFVTGIVLFGMVHMSIANYTPQMGGWSDPPGKFIIALGDTMLQAPYVISILLMIIGVIMFSMTIFREIANKKILDRKNNKIIVSR